jgi:integrase
VTAREPRALPLNVMWELLLLCADKQAQDVLTSRSGDPLRRSNFRRRFWLPALRKAKTRAFRFHDLRHAAVTTLMEHGATEAELKAQVGHKDSRMMQRYQHAHPAHQRKVINSVGKAYAEALPATGTDNIVPLRGS